MKKIFLGLLIFPFVVFSQSYDRGLMYQKVGIKSIRNLEDINYERKINFEADSVYINGFKLSFDNIDLTYSKVDNIIKIGDRYLLKKLDDYKYSFLNGKEENIIDILQSEVIDKEIETRFIILAFLLNDLNVNEDYLLPDLDFSYRHCGVWEVIGYGHSQSGSMLNALLNAEGFGNSHGNCGQSGGPSTSCITDQHFCFTSYTFYCSCSVTIPFIGLGWD